MYITVNRLLFKNILFSHDTSIREDDLFANINAMNMSNACILKFYTFPTFCVMRLF